MARALASNWLALFDWPRRGWIPRLAAAPETPTLEAAAQLAPEWARREVSGAGTSATPRLPQPWEVQRPL